MNSRIYRYFVNYVNRNKIQGNGKICLDKEDYLFIDKSAQLHLNGNLVLNANRIRKRNGRSSILRMDSDTSIITNGSFSFMYGADIILFKGAKLELGANSYINSDCKIRCHQNITIGDYCAISHDFTILDSDAHILDGLMNINPINIGNHVWIGTRVTVLSGVNIGDGAVVASGSIVKDDVPNNCLVAGVPARIIRTDVTWGIPDAANH